MNAARAIGNFLQLLTVDLIKKSAFVGLFNKLLMLWLKIPPQVRWNACYALGNAMKNEALYDSSLNGSPMGNWQSLVFNSLMELVITFRNFKVRINAAVALSSPPQRKYYSQFFHAVWVSLLKAIPKKLERKRKWLSAIGKDSL
ncbi:hypothetical protein NQ317_001146 [Molorchus minor]|uniref:Uncharacterized protein n=1 Tax=Molorchus minor TaxID=1323400 RepID=A0ABQ9IY85_9CUCU|nr:hypothetical protein NQ317_001146 [Molorchus minor]